MNSVSALISAACGFCLVASPFPVKAATARPDRIFVNDQVGEACELAERTGFPLCIAVIDRLPRDKKVPELEPYWKTAIERLSSQCVVLNIDYSQNDHWHFLQLLMRTRSASLDLDTTGIQLVDPWQEKKLDEAKINYFDFNDPDKERRMLGNFKDRTAKLLQTATDWNLKHGAKPETWADSKGRAMTATALGTDATTARFKLSKGQMITVPLATLDGDSVKRLLAAYSPAVPILDANDAAALEKHVGKEVVVLSRERKYRGPSISTMMPNNLPMPQMRVTALSHLVNITLLNTTEQAIRKTHPDGIHADFLLPNYTRVRGILQRRTNPNWEAPFLIEIKEFRQLGAGIPRL
jgi:hypothetical protein